MVKMVLGVYVGRRASNLDEWAVFDSRGREVAGPFKTRKAAQAAADTM